MHTFTLHQSFAFASGHKLSFHGDMCDGGHFLVARACQVGSDPTFHVGEHWIDNYQCTDNDDPSRVGVRRIDIVITETTDAAVKAITKFEHEDATCRTSSRSGKAATGPPATST